MKELDQIRARLRSGVFAQAGRDVAALTESVARKEAELKAAREAAK